MEGVRCYRTSNYLAACVLSGAAAESILLAIAIEKTGDEAAILAEYKAASGRGRVKKRVTAGLDASRAAQFESALHVLSYWPDDAGHGTVTTISEIEAFTALSLLLRLAQFTHDHWTTLCAT